MRVKAFILAGACLGALTLAAPAAQADVGVIVGPARQYIEPGQGIAKFLISNTTGRAMTVDASEWYYDGQGWVEEDVPFLSHGRPFTVEAGSSQEVYLGVSIADRACRLVGVGFSVEGVTANGVTARGVSLAQLAIAGGNGTEADCVAVLPARPAPPPEPFHFPWVWVAGGAGALLLFLAGRRTKRDRSKAVGFG